MSRYARKKKISTINLLPSLKRKKQQNPFTISFKWQILYRWRILLNRIVEMSLYIITTLLPNQMECLWLLAWKRLANKATHGRIQQKEKHDLTWDANNINIFPRIGKTSWNSSSHNLKLLIQILQEEIEFFFFLKLQWMTFPKAEESAETHRSRGFIALWYFRHPFREQITSVQMCAYATYIFEVSSVLETSYMTENSGSI